MKKLTPIEKDLYSHFHNPHPHGGLPLITPTHPLFMGSAWGSTPQYPYLNRGSARGLQGGYPIHPYILPLMPLNGVHPPHYFTGTLYCIQVCNMVCFYLIGVLPVSYLMVVSLIPVTMCRLHIVYILMDH